MIGFLASARDARSTTERLSLMMFSLRQSSWTASVQPHSCSQATRASPSVVSQSRCCPRASCSTADVGVAVNYREVSRRTALLTQAAAASMLLQAKLAAAADAAKQTNLPIEQLKDIIAHDFQTGQYYITGNLTQSVFADDCVFQDPTTRVHGPEYYSTAVAKLFDQETSRADLISIEVKDPHTIMTRWRFAAALKVPGRPKLKPYTGSTMYRINSQGLIAEHIEEWDISALDAFVSIFLPSFGAPAAPPVNHPVAA